MVMSALCAGDIATAMRLLNNSKSELASTKQKIARYVKIFRNLAYSVKIGLSAARFPKTDGLVAYTESLAELPL